MADTLSISQPAGSVLELAFGMDTRAEQHAYDITAVDTSPEVGLGIGCSRSGLLEALACKA